MIAPTGKVEAGESLQNAVVLEALEEPGVPVRIIAPPWRGRTDTGIFHLHWFAACAEAGEAMRVSADKIDAVRWIIPE